MADPEGGGRGIALIRSTPVVVVALWLTWSSAFIAIKVGLTAASPEVFALLRVLVAISALGLGLLAQRVLRGRTAHGRGLHRYAVILGITNVVGFLFFQTLGMVDLQVGLSSMLIYTQPLLVALGARLLLGERLTPRRLFGLLCGWLGVIVVVAAEIDAGAARWLPVVLLLCAALCWALGTLVFKALPDDVDLWHLLWWQNVYGLLPIAVLAASRSGTLEVGPVLVLGALWAGIGASIGGFGLQFILLRRGEASVVSSWIFAVPVLASALGVLVLDEALHLGLALGAVLVAAGIYLVNTTARGRAGRLAAARPDEATTESG